MPKFNSLSLLMGERYSLGDHEQLTIKGQDTTELIFDATTVPAGDRLTIEAIATAGTMRDGIQREVPIRPWGTRIHRYSERHGRMETEPFTLNSQPPKRWTRKGTHS